MNHRTQHAPDRREPGVDFRHTATVREPDPDGTWLLTFTTTGHAGWVVTGVRAEHGGTVTIAVCPGRDNHPRTPPAGFRALPP